MLISDHINLTADSPLEGATFIDLTDLYSPRLRDIARTIDPTLDEGVYTQFRGPHYETPAEVQMAKTIGGHIVGMSTALEAIAARAGRHGDPRLLAHHEPRRRHPEDAAQPRGGASRPAATAEPVISALLARVIGGDL